VNRHAKMPVEIGVKTFVKDILQSFCCWCKKKGNDQKIFKKGREKLDRDLSMIALIESIHKLKSCCQVLMKADQLRLAKIVYLNSMYIEETDSGDDYDSSE